jgi:hypothetical protein
MKNLITLLALSLSFFLIGCESPTGSSPEIDPNVENPTDTINVPVDTAFVPEPTESSSSEVTAPSSSSEVAQPTVKGTECLVDGSKDCSNAVFPEGFTINGNLSGYDLSGLTANDAHWTNVILNEDTDLTGLVSTGSSWFAVEIRGDVVFTESTLTGSCIDWDSVDLRNDGKLVDYLDVGMSIERNGTCK